MYLNPFQTAFADASADIVGFCASVGAGKTYSLLSYGFDRTRHTLGFNALVTSHSVKPHAALVDAAHYYKHYCNMGAYQDDVRVHYANHALLWDKQQSRMTFRQIDTMHTLIQLQGSRFDYVGIDNLQDFTQEDMLYIHSRTRKDTDASLRVTFLPDEESWPYQFFAPWFDKKYYSPADFGEIRSFYRIGSEIHWLPKGVQSSTATSVTIIKPTYTYTQPLKYVDEVSDFTEDQFFYMLSRSRSTGKK